jgi:uncharacterized protein
MDLISLVNIILELLMRIFLLCFSLFIISSFAEDKKPAFNQDMNDEGMNYRVLLWSKTSWYRHPQIPELSGWLVRFLGQHKIQVDLSESSKDINIKNLMKYDAVILSSTTDIGVSLDEKQKSDFINWFERGGSLIGLHAALVHHDHWKWYSDLVGCGFDSDSLHGESTLVVDPKAEGHPAVVSKKGRFQYSAEWLNYTKSVSELSGVQVLLRVDEKSYDPVRPYFKTKGGKAMGEDHPVSWTRIYKGGRFFYTAIGHDKRSTNTEFGRKHVLNGILWAIGNKKE